MTQTIPNVTFAFRQGDEAPEEGGTDEEEGGEKEGEESWYK